MKLRYFPIILILSIQSIYAQTVQEAKYFDFSTSPPVSDVIFRARDYVNLNPDVTVDGSQNLVFEIDPSLVFPVDYIPWDELQDPDSRILNTSLPVGTTEGIADVSLTGAATYSIPISISPGTSGMVPQLTITYNSQGSNGTLGMGWDISGHTAITRTPQNFYYDGQVEGINFDSEDPYAMDGNRLILVGSEYRTANETFARIIPHGTAGSGPQWFEVITKTGSVIQYGYTADSRIEAQGRADVLVWNVNKISDVKGNYIKFTYHEDNGDGESWLEKIQYTGNSGADISPYNEIKFFYEERDDIINVYIKDSRIQQSVLLYKIQVLSEGKIVRTYEFKYSKDLYSHLSEIYEYGANGHGFNTTLVTWNEHTALSEVVNTFDNNEESLFYFGDFNADGQTDLATAPNKDEYSPEDELKMYTIYPDGEYFSYNWDTTLHELHCDNSFYHYNFYKNLGFQTYDFNGDGREDLLLQQYIDLYPECNPECYYYNYRRFYGRGDNLEPVYDFYVSVPVGGKVVFGDFNGDGKTDYKRFLPSSDYINYDLNVIDFNGDGKMDIIAINQNESFDPEDACIVFDEGNTMQELYHGGYPTKWHSIFYGDFNGDRKTDVLTYTDDYYWQIAISKGNGFIWPLSNAPITRTIDPDASEGNDNYYVTDFNGDGKADILEVYTVADVHSYFNVYFSNGAGNFDKDANWVGNMTPNQDEVFFGDFNGDGFQECFVKTGPVEDPARIIRFRPKEQKQLVKSVTNGLNIKTDFTYKPLTDFSVYSKGSGHTYPLNDIELPLHVVSSVTANNGLGGFNTVAYKYTGALIHRKGKGYLGFTEIKVTDQTNWIVTKTTNQLNSTFYFLTPQSIHKELLNGTDISDIAYTNAVKDFGENRIFPYISMITNTDYLKGFTSYKDFNYNETDILNGNLTYEQSRYDAHTITRNDYTYIAVNNAWRILKATITKKRYNKPDYIRTVDYGYFTDGLMEHEITDLGKPKSVTTSYTYDACGNPLTTTISASGLASRTATMTYDQATKRFLLTKENALGHKSQYEYDNRFGTIIRETDPNNLLTRYSYDEFGRLTSTILPTGKIINNSINWITDGTPPLGLYYTTTTSTGSPSVTEYFDQLGRSILIKSTGWNGTPVYTTTEYTASGDIYRQSESYISGETPFWTTYKYDDFLRLEIMTMPACSLSYSYVLNSVTTTDCLGRTNSKTYSPDGTLYQSSDPGGDISYSYYASGLVEQIQAAGGTTGMEYDDYGRQTKLIDPDAGIIEYEYNAYGELERQKNYRNQITSMTYDELGRIKTEAGPDLGNTYFYDTQKKGLLSSVIGILATTSYTYDTYSRLSTTSKIYNEKTYSFSYTYDNSKQKIKTTTYPSGYRIENEYDNNGYLTEVRRTDAGHSELIWECLNMNKRGQITQAKLGNNLNVTRTYDLYGYPEIIQTGSVQNMEFDFNPNTGNLNWREDNLPGRDFSEFFTYDPLDRLTNCAIGTNNYGVSYAQNGNINTKFDAGAYQYNLPQPHAVSMIESTEPTMGPDQLIPYYTSFEQSGSISEAGKTLVFAYDYDKQRIRADYNDGSTSWTRIYLGNYEEMISSGQPDQYIHYLPGGDGLAAIYIKKSDETEATYYVSKDYLGNILLLTKQDGTVAEEYSYDAWGRRRSPVDWTSYAITPPSILYRGFTGHEHLDEFGLINMNGRLYDPIVGRFLSPDNFVQGDFTQAFNRYTYALNNPLVIADPDGENPLLIAALIGASVSMGSYTIGVAVSKGGFDNWDWQKFGQSALIGAIGSIGGGASGAFMAQFTSANGALAGSFIGGLSGAAMGAANGIVMNGLSNMMAGKDFWYYWSDAAKQGALSGGIMGSYTGALNGYYYAKRIGANPWTGRLYSNIRYYSATLKTGVPLNQYQDRYCYAVANEYADYGHGNLNRSKFIAQAGGAYGYDAGDAATPLGMNMIKRFRPRYGSDWDFIGMNLKYGNEVEGSFKTGLGFDDNHWINIVGIVVSEKAKIFGGGFKTVLNSTTIWDNTIGLTIGKNDYLSIIIYAY